MRLLGALNRPRGSELYFFRYEKDLVPWTDIVRFFLSTHYACGISERDVLCVALVSHSTKIAGLGFVEDNHYVTLTNPPDDEVADCIFEFMKGKSCYDAD